MSNEVTFELNGCEELAAKINELLKVYPNETASEMEKITNDFKKDVNKKFPNGGKSGSKSVSKNWKKYKMQSLAGYTVSIEMQNSAPHFHLVENGHELYMSAEMYAAYSDGSLGHISRGRSSGKKGSTKAVHAGFVPGKHYCEKTRNEWNNGEFEKHVKKHVKKLLKKVDLA